MRLGKNVRIDPECDASFLFQPRGSLGDRFLEGCGMRFEFSLRRKVDDAGNDQPTLMGTDEVPRGFRELVEEYYRTLGKGTSASTQSQSQPPPPQR